MKPVFLGILGGVVIGMSVPSLYLGVGTGILTCADRHQSESCEANYTRTALAEVGAAVGVLGCVGALWWARRRRS